MRLRVGIFLLLLLLFGNTLLGAATLQVAVASNFTAPAQRLAERFAQESGEQAVLSFASTAKLYAQISNGAPFDCFLAADAESADKLLRAGRAVAGSRLTYALGKLLLWSAQSGYVDGQGERLRRGDFAHLALADPRLAPYGRAAVEVLRALGLLESLQSKWVLGENIAQTHQFVATGNAELGFVALAQQFEGGALNKGSAWLVPEELYQPIRQVAVLLERGKENPAALAWMRFLQTEQARAIIRSYGYGEE
ncbi:molybdate ABC transporter substrate-binding protein [Candidatus Magnetaquicoccus inordinatus]|uniref:molybdate ABC transporter substrate-binding protein n=1 Tax=Candidatus Magnetaquicoccus inordinatus TaxID=2496818 RepID=UPI00102BCB8C|nr:molybdate ABC transporter substrate-binding protein [Candidatus Magnetaquicoccus inordinatus]